MRPPKQKQPQVKNGLCRVLEHVDVDDKWSSSQESPTTQCCNIRTIVISEGRRFNEEDSEFFRVSPSHPRKKEHFFNSLTGVNICQTLDKHFSFSSFLYHKFCILCY